MNRGSNKLPTRPLPVGPVRASSLASKTYCLSFTTQISRAVPLCVVNVSVNSIGRHAVGILPSRLASEAPLHTVVLAPAQL